jgi:hypothetical protein
VRSRITGDLVPAVVKVRPRFDAPWVVPVVKVRDSVTGQLVAMD